MTPNSDNDQHLRLLGIFHYVVAGLTALFACFPLIYLAVGWFILHAPPPKNGEPPPAFVGWIIMAVGGFLFLLGESFAASVFAAGRSIRSRRHYWFVFVMAGLQCAFFPFGTVLGVFAIVVLSRASVKESFGQVTSEQPRTT